MVTLTVSNRVISALEPVDGLRIIVVKLLASSTGVSVPAEGNAGMLELADG